MLSTSKTEKKTIPSIFESSSKISLFTAFARFMGFVRNIVIAYVLGSGLLSDIYSTANMIPTFVYDMVAGGILSSAFVPIYVRYLQNAEKNETQYMISNFINVVFTWAIAISFLIMIFTPEIVQLITYRNPTRNTATTVMFFRIFAFQIAFYSLAAMFNGILNSHRRFVVPLIMSALNNITVIVVILLIYKPLQETNKELALLLLAVGTTLGAVIMAVGQIPFLKKVGHSFSLNFNFRHPAIRQIIKLGLPILGYTIVLQINNIVVYTLIQPFTGGAIAYTQAMAIYQLPYAIFGAAFATAMFPELTRFSNKNELDRFKTMLLKLLNMTSFVIIPASIFLGIMAQPLVRLILQHGKFDASGSQLTADLLSFFALALLSMSLFSVLDMVFYALQDMITPLLAAIGVFSFQIAVNFWIIDSVGIGILPLSACISLTLGVIFKLVLLHRKLGSISMLDFSISVFKHAIAGICAGISMFLVQNVLTGADADGVIELAFGLLFAMVIGAIIYLIASRSLKVRELDLIRDLLSAKFSKQAKAA